ncbi:hypothetical protein SRABI106_04678 [Rahnella aquatilis]|nr:hypothetical protein SRABI106_04678 [Rahnella aquatilis]
MFRLNVDADFGIEPELNAHFSEDFPAPDQHVFIQLERRNTKGQQAADLRVTIKDHGFYAMPRQHVSAAQSGRACTHHGYAIITRNNL